MSKPVPAGFDRVLFTEEQIDQRIREVAAAISERYRGRDLKLVGVLKGAVFFLTALARQIIQAKNQLEKPTTKSKGRKRRLKLP